MKKIFKQMAYLAATMFFMTTPVVAGQVELQTEVPVYTVKDGMELTEEEQRAIHATIDYFIANPEADYVVLNSNDFPSIKTQKFEFIEGINRKIDAITEKYTVTLWDGHYTTSSQIEPYSIVFRGNGYTEITILNHYSKSISEKEKSPSGKQIQDWIAYAQSLLPQLGITDGMDERQAIDIINNFVCDYITYDNAPQYDYTNIFETQRGKCNDYATLFKALADGAGIDCYRVVSSTHAWNRVIIDGQVLEIDSCWNDSDYGTRYDYYLIPREQMSKAEFHEEIIEVF